MWTPRQGVIVHMPRVLNHLLAAFPIPAAALALQAAPAGAAACAGDLSVAGKAVSGDDCTVLGDGSVKIKNPRFGASGAVKLLGPLGEDATMTLNSARTSMVPDSGTGLMQLRVGSKPLMM